MVKKEDLRFKLAYPQPKPKKASRQERLYAVTTPIWDEDMGDRLRYARMALLKTQREMAELLGIRQQELAKLEGARSMRMQVPLAKFEAVLGRYFSFMLLGSDEDKLPQDVFMRYRKYMARNRGNKQARSERWYEAQRERAAFGRRPGNYVLKK